MQRVGIVGSTGMVGEGLILALLGHPHVELAYLASEHAAGEDISDVLPVLKGQLSITCRKPDPEALVAETDVVFLAMKSAKSMEMAPRLLEGGKRVIDIGGEFRLKDPREYEQWYGNAHLCPELLPEAVYGLPEIHRERVEAARLVANPGCYPTGAIIPLAPLLREGWLRPDSIVVDAFSGLSGAGRTYSASSQNLFVDCNESVRAYGTTGHKHRPEIEQELSGLAGRREQVVFIPHLVPLTRGIHSTIFADLEESLTSEAALAELRQHYADEPFVRVFDKPEAVTLSNVQYTNYCDVSAVVDDRTNRLIMVSALDNLVKGAHGQAVQNLNIMCGFDETTALVGRRI